MIDSKRLIDVMPRMSGNEYKVFVYLLYGYDMARNAYSQPYYERSQSEIAKDTGVPVSTQKRIVENLEELKLVSRESFQRGVSKTRTRYYILDYDQYLVHNEPANNDNAVQNGLSIIVKNEEKESEKKTTRPDLNDLYTKSRNYGDALGVQTTIEGINRIKDEFVKLWDEAGALYVYERKYQEDKEKNWEAFRKRYDGVKSRINKRTNTHTPKQVDKRDKRESAEMNGGGAPPRRRSGMEWDMRSYNPDYAAGMDFHPSIIKNYLNSLQAFLKRGYCLDKEQQNRAILSVREWIETNWVDGVKEELVNAGVDKEDEVWLTKDEWKEYVRNMITAFNINPVNPPRISSTDDEVF